MLERAHYFYENLKNDFILFQKSFTIFDNNYIEDFDNTIIMAKLLPLDNEMFLKISLISDDIENIMNESRRLIQKLFVYVKSAYNYDKSIIKTFGKKDFEKARNSKLLMTELLKKAYNLAKSEEYHDGLVKSGLSLDDIMSLNELNITLTNLLNARDDAKFKRQKKTKERIQIYNQVWSFIEQISNASKIVFADNPTKIKQYLLYPSVNNLPFKIDKFYYDNETSSIYWNSSQNSETYELVFKPSDNSSDWEKIYTGENTSYLIKQNGGDKMYRCRGINIYGFGYWSDIILVED